MKNAIKEYLEFSDQEKEDLWSNASFVFDTNVLLNLYRYSNNTRNQLFDAIDDLKDRIWIPYQVAYEFCKDRYAVIEESNKRFEKLKNSINSLVGGWTNERLVESNDPDLGNLEKYLNKWIDKKKNSYLLFDYTEDSVLNKVLNLFDGKTGNKYPADQIATIEKEGKDRYSNKIPPGYKDIDKPENKYGDLIVWKEIIDYAKENNKDIIFVTHDQKEDWWKKVGGKTIGPRPELRKEFSDETGKKFHMYTMTSFLSYCNDIKEDSIDKTTINEVETIEDKGVPDIIYYPYIPQKNVLSRKQIIDDFLMHRKYAFDYHERDYQEKINRLQRKNYSRENTISKLEQKKKSEGLTPEEEIALKRNKERYLMDLDRIIRYKYESIYDDKPEE